MFGWTLTHAVIALFAAAFGFSGIGGAAEEVGQIAFAIFLTLTVITVLVRTVKGKPPV